MSSIIVESADPVVLGLEVVRSDVAKEVPPRLRHVCHPYSEFGKKLKLFKNKGPMTSVRKEVLRKGKKKKITTE